MSIQEFCRITEMSAHTLRYYERVGLMLRVERNASGHRRYTDRHVSWVSFLRSLRIAGMPVAAIRRYIALIGEGAAGDARRMELLRAHKKDVTARLYELRVHLATINRKLRDGCGPDGERTAATRKVNRAARRMA